MAPGLCCPVSLGFKSIPGGKGMDSSSVYQIAALGESRLPVAEMVVQIIFLGK